MNVMPAGMHYTYIAPAVIFSANFAGIRQPGFFFNRQAVKLGTEHHGWARAIFQDRDDACPAHMLRDFIAQSAQAISQLGCRPRLMGRKFRVLVQVKVQGLCFGKHRS